MKSIITIVCNNLLIKGILEHAQSIFSSSKENKDTTAQKSSYYSKIKPISYSKIRPIIPKIMLVY